MTIRLPRLLALSVVIMAVINNSALAFVPGPNDPNPSPPNDHSRARTEVTAQSSQTNQMALYTDPEYEFSILYPATWRVDRLGFVSAGHSTWEIRYIAPRDFYSAVVLTIERMDEGTEQPHDTPLEKTFIKDDWRFTLRLDTTADAPRTQARVGATDLAADAKTLAEMADSFRPSKGPSTLDQEEQPNSGTAVADSFMFPTGYDWTFEYGAHPTWWEGNSTCFETAYKNLFHAAQDRGKPANTIVQAVANGEVYWYDANYNTYPGRVVVIRHTLTDGNTIYSMYGHLASVAIQQGQTVSKGQQIGVILDQSSNSHLHWEMRSQGSMAWLCNTNAAGPGYTYPNWPDSYGYTNPVDFVNSHQGGGGEPNYTPPSGYTFCSWEGERCSFSDTRDVAYGVNGTFDYKYGVSGGIDCNNNSFVDPVPGVKKQCFTKGGSSGGGVWRAEYYDSQDMWWDINNYSWHKCGEDLPGATLGKDYGSGAPCSGMRNNGDQWVGNYTKKVNFSAGKYVFYSDHDDGAKLIIEGVNNGNPIMDSGGKEYSKICNGQDGYYLSGEKNVRVILREDGGEAKITLTWDTNTSACVPPKPSAPTLKLPENNSTKPSNYDVTFEWNSASGASEYLVEFWGGPYSGNQQPCGWSSSTLCHVGTMWSGNTYSWHVKSRNSSGESNWSDTWSFTVQAQQQPPAAPTLRLPENNSTKSSSYDLTFEWNSVSGATNYQVEWWGGPYSTMRPCDGTSATSCHIGQIQPGYTYYWKVKARNGAGEGNWSDTWSFTIQTQQQAPPTPSNFRVTGTTQTTVSLVWDDAANEDGYKVFKWSGVDFPLYRTLSANQTTFTDTGLTCGSAYFYKVSAYNTVGECQ